MSYSFCEPNFGRFSCSYQEAQIEFVFYSVAALRQQYSIWLEGSSDAAGSRDINRNINLKICLGGDPLYSINQVNAGAGVPALTPELGVSYFSFN